MVDVAEKEVSAQSHFPIAGDLFVGRFTIESVLNRGGFGCVYKAMQNDLGRPVAIKVLRPATRIGFNDDVSAEERRLEIVSKRFEREAQLVSQLRDPHTVLMYEYGQTPDGLLYMVLEFISGDALSRVVEVEGAISPDRAVNIVLQVLSSLEEAHARGVLHRDIKPPNIMLYSHMGRADQVKVLDFGLAKSMDDPIFSADNPDLTDDEVLIGTPRYMSPEQIRGHRLAPSTDIYSLGLVFYELPDSAARRT
jgi:serine/threonine protein kinase